MLRRFGGFEDLGGFGFGDFEGVNAAQARAPAVDMEHYAGGFFVILVEETLENLHHEIHRGVVVVQKINLVHRRPLGLRLGFHGKPDTGIGGVAVLLLRACGSLGHWYVSCHKGDYTTGQFMIHPTPRSGPSFARLRIGLFGGSFNPAHDGHLAMSLYALKHLRLDQVWWLVSPQNPLKSQEDMWPLAERLRSAEALAAPHPRLVVTTLESKLGTCYSIDTVNELKRRYPQTRFVWLMGADNLQAFHRWRRWEDLFHTLPIAVFRRPGYGAGQHHGRAALRFAGAARPGREAPCLAGLKAPAWLMLDNRLNGLSSTQIRHKRQKNKD